MSWLQVAFLVLMVSPIVVLWLADLWLDHRRRR